MRLMNDNKNKLNNSKNKLNNNIKNQFFKPMSNTTLVY